LIQNNKEIGMKKFFEIIDLIVGTINQTMAVLGLSIGVLLAFINVILRYAFDMSLTWAAELTNYLFIWSALFGAAYGFKQGAHISVTLLIEKFPPIATKSLLVFANFISIAYLGIMSYFGYELILLLKDFGEESVDLGIPMWIPHLVLPIAFALAAYRAAEKLVIIYNTDADDIKLFSEHETVINEVTSQKGEN
jgi:C4-dicarboxylate transporter DctQ subunit